MLEEIGEVVKPGKKSGEGELATGLAKAWGLPDTGPLNFHVSCLYLKFPHLNDIATEIFFLTTGPDPSPYHRSLVFSLLLAMSLAYSLAHVSMFPKEDNLPKRVVLASFFSP